MFGPGCRRLAELACRSSADCSTATWQTLLQRTAAAAPGALDAGHSRRYVNTRTSEGKLNPPRLQWVFLGPPGVGKGTYSTRVAVALGVAHIAAGDLVRYEMTSGTALGKQMQSIVNEGDLLTDEMITELLFRRIETGKRKGEKGFVLDGFPRTVVQSQELMDSHDIQLAVNLSLRQEVLIEKCMGRRICRKCGKGWNLADIYLPGGDGRPPIVMPPLDPPVDCRPFMEQREDDKEAVIRKRLENHNEQAQPVADFFRDKGILLDFEITGGIPETLPMLYQAIKPHTGNWTLADLEIGTSAT